MLCPYCISDITLQSQKCAKCGREIPPLYREHYPKAPFSSPQPLMMSAVGFRGHGKTIYFASLLHVMQSELTKVWKGFYRQGIDREAVKVVRHNLQLLERGEVPDATPKSFPYPNVHRLANIPGKGDKLLVIYDASGESFEEDLQMERYLDYLRRIRTVLFLISLDDLEEPLDEDIHRLLDIYVQGMARLKAKAKDQHLIVVYTKADVLHNRFRDYPDVVDHLSSASYTELGDLKRYERKLESISAALRDYTNNGLGARNFINMADAKFKSSVFCAVSSLGSAPIDGRLKDKMTPMRVVDPLIWMLARG